ncbi:MAG: hypothetical protein RLZZ165_788 [Bacteroidota bacterium]|jgi:hypothetical protein
MGIVKGMLRQPSFVLHSWLLDPFGLLGLFRARILAFPLRRR